MIQATSAVGAWTLTRSTTTANVIQSTLPPKTRGRMRTARAAVPTPPPAYTMLGQPFSPVAPITLTSCKVCSRSQPLAKAFPFGWERKAPRPLAMVVHSMTTVGQ